MSEASNQLALRDRSDMLAPATDSWVAVVRDVSTLASQICDTDFVPTDLRWREGELIIAETGEQLRDLGPAAARVTAVILHGRELGLPPMTSLAMTHIIEGRPSISAEAMRAMVLQAGHEILPVETTSAKCVMKGRRRSRSPFGMVAGATGEWTTVEWTLADAQRLGVTYKKNWVKSPRAMLQARASTELCRLIFPDVIHGMRAIEEFDELEVGAGDTGEPPAIEATTIRRAGGRQGRPQVTAEATPSPQNVPGTLPRKRPSVPQRGTQGRVKEESGITVETREFLPGTPAPTGEADDEFPGQDDCEHCKAWRAANTPFDERLIAPSHADIVAAQHKTSPGSGPPTQDEAPTDGAPTPDPETPPATLEPEQPPPNTGRLAAMHAHADRLGFGDEGQRDFRLTVLATLAGVDPITTSKELTNSQASQAIEAMAKCRDREAFDAMMETRS